MHFSLIYRLQTTEIKDAVAKEINLGKIPGKRSRHDHFSLLRCSRCVLDLLLLASGRFLGFAVVAVVPAPIL